MKRIARFEKVSFEQFKKDWIDTFDIVHTPMIQAVYDNIKLPKRATIGSAGYDFFTPIIIELKPNETIKIPTGIRVAIEENWVLQCYPRSSIGFKTGVRMVNTIPIIDSDYYYSKNEGHIFIKIENNSSLKKILTVNQGEAFAQGIFIEYGITVDDDTDGVRNGGFGSTNNKI